MILHWHEFAINMTDVPKQRVVCVRMHLEDQINSTSFICTQRHGFPMSLPKQFAKLVLVPRPLWQKTINRLERLSHRSTMMEQISRSKEKHCKTQLERHSHACRQAFSTENLDNHHQCKFPMPIRNFAATASSPTWELNSHLVLSILDFGEVTTILYTQQIIEALVKRW